MLHVLAQATVTETVLAVMGIFGAGVAATLVGRKGWSIIIRPREEEEDKPERVQRTVDDCARRHAALMKAHEQFHREAEKRQDERYGMILLSLTKLEGGLEKLEGGLTRVHTRIDNILNQRQE